MIRYLFNPARLIQENLEGKGAWIAFLFSGLAFALFFLQTALDSGSPILFGIVKGALFGTVGIALAGAIIWQTVKLAGNNVALGSVMGAVALSYSSTLVFAVVGLILHFSLGWNTAISCGITGVLSAFGPMSGVISGLTGEKKTLNLFIVTFTGVYVLLFWALLNNML
jgi:hypothetical protein